MRARVRTTSSARLMSFVSGIVLGEEGEEKEGFSMLSASISDLRSVQMRWTKVSLERPGGSFASNRKAAVITIACRWFCIYANVGVVKNN